MKANNTYAKNKLYKKDYALINLRYEYPNYTGKEKWAFVTDMTEIELVNKYPDKIKEYVPYIILPTSFFDVRNVYLKNENKHRMRQTRNVDVWGYDEEFVFNNHPELIENGLEIDVDKIIDAQNLRKAIANLKPKQRERLIKYFFYGISSRRIARQEGVSYSAIDKTIAGALKKLRKFLK
ncbi:MAG: sigma-70 family RNA polymerase sigma factor [Ruminococcus sp.]|nr:sigma-70 family RNA polymerase sigma factor [Ruminococcus sp.]